MQADADVDEDEVRANSVNLKEIDASALTVEEIDDLIKLLKRAKSKAKRREQDSIGAKTQDTLHEESEQRSAATAASVTLDLPLDWEDAFYPDEALCETHVDTIGDGLVLSLANLGRVDIEYIAAISETDCPRVIKALKGLIYQNPLTWNMQPYAGWETADEYLSGRLIEKWEAACEASREYPDRFDANVTALERVMPMPIAKDDIYITLGSPWVPTDVIDDFIVHVFGAYDWYEKDSNGDYRRSSEVPEWARVRHDEITGSWQIPDRARYGKRVSVMQTYGTSCIDGMRILEKTLNLQPLAVNDEMESQGGMRRVLNQEETTLALEKQKKLIEEFKRWVWTDEHRAERLVTIFERKFGCTRRRVYDGSFLTFPSMSPSQQLYPYQKDAVARILFSRNTLLAHDVGSGKTYVMVAAGMELRRLGLSRKNLYVVPNNVIGQWREIFLKLYPKANLLCVEPRNFQLDKREAMLDTMRKGDFDAIIIAYSSFELIPLSKSYYKGDLERTLAGIEAATRSTNRATTRARRKWRALQEALQALKRSMNDLYDRTYFDDLGITRIFVDEAHNFKNIPLDTKMRSVLGISTNGSKRCQDMLDKVRQVQKSDGGAVLATGTPITNSVSDVYAIQRYLQSDELALVGLQSFDSWVGMFAEQTTEFEIDVDAAGFRMATRLSKFHNLTELTSLLSSVADFHRLDSSANIPEFSGYDDVLVERTPEFETYLGDISRRADSVRWGLIASSDDNMLKITSDGRKAALDMRLVDPQTRCSKISKVACCAENVLSIYTETSKSRSTQIVFCDISTPKDAFNLYDELKRLLVSRGVSEDEVAFVHEAQTTTARDRLFSRVRSGEIRVLLGSTFKLGLGVNVQDRLVALHHLDVPWRPADMMQREGRILRQGNANRRVRIFRYITKGSFDAYSWQLLETKQRFIQALLAGSFSRQSAEDVDGTALNYAEVKALAAGNPLIKERFETANTLEHYCLLQLKASEARMRIEQEIANLPEKIAEKKDQLSRCACDYEFFRRAMESKTRSTSDDDRARRSEMRKQIALAFANSQGVRVESELFSYRGFSVILPVNMAQDKPFIWLKRSGRYRVDMGESEEGYLTRIDNFLKSLDKREAEIDEEISNLNERSIELSVELAKEEDYAEQIEWLRGRLEELDEELGVIR